jgi:hypothetical protein
MKLVSHGHVTFDESSGERIEELVWDALRDAPGITATWYEGELIILKDKAK